MSNETETLTDVVPDEVEEIAAKLLKRACDQKLTIVTAESCTGGLLAALLTDVEGASHAFERGFVTYTDDAKRDVLHVPADLLDAHGAVSEPVAIAMAEGALRASPADIALAVTGFAGEGAPGDEPGLVHLACARRSGRTTHREQHFGDIGRGPVRIACLRVALELLAAALGGS